MKHLLNFGLGVIVVLAACAPPPPPPPGAPPSVGGLPTPMAVVQNTAAPAVVNQPSAAAQAPTSVPVVAPQVNNSAERTYLVNRAQLPIGDSKYSTGPQRGYVWSCRVQTDNAGAFTTGPWYNAAAGMYDVTLKPTVDGAVSWPSEFSVAVQGDKRVFSFNNLPVHSTGIYPISASDDAYNYDRNPGSISAQTLQFELPANPTLTGQAACVGGEVGVLLTGAVLFNAFDAGSRDAVAHEIQDACGGHPQNTGIYHYHSLTPCGADGTSGHSALAGYAFDGFGIYGHHGENGAELTNADLDECHGHTHVIEWEGQMVEMYHYHATWEFPYTVGCYRGTLAVNGPLGSGGGQPAGGGNNGGNPPPQPGGGGNPPPPRVP